MVAAPAFQEMESEKAGTRTPGADVPQQSDRTLLIDFPAVKKGKSYAADQVTIQTVYAASLKCDDQGSD